jgi:hypothetical protein
MPPINFGFTIATMVVSIAGVKLTATGGESNGAMVNPKRPKRTLENHHRNSIQIMHANQSCEFKSETQFLKRDQRLIDF